MANNFAIFFRNNVNMEGKSTIWDIIILTDYQLVLVCHQIKVM